MRERLIEQLQRFRTWNEQEEKDREILLHCLQTQGDIFSRENRIAHMTASGWVVNGDRTKILMAYHNLYASWAWLGGHADGLEDLLRVALREVQEESGLMKVRPLSMEPYSLEVLTVNGHWKNGVYVSSHLHLNVTYLFEASEQETLRVKPDENSGVAWFGLEEGVAASSELWFRENIYAKLNEKLVLLEGIDRF